MTGASASCGTNRFAFSFTFPLYRADGAPLKDGEKQWIVARSRNIRDAAYNLAGAYNEITFADERPDQAQFVSQNMPAIATGSPAIQFTQTFTNTGSNPWLQSTHYLVPVVPGYLWNVGPGIALPSTVQPGQSVTFTWAPGFNRGEGTYTSVWQMARSGVPFGQKSPSADTEYRPATGNGSGVTQPPVVETNSPLPYGTWPPSNPVLVQPPGP